MDSTTASDAKQPERIEIYPAAPEPPLFSLRPLLPRPVSKRSAPFRGAVRIMAGSSLRKLMRAARRGKVPAERIRVIVQAMQSAARRDWVWLHSRARRRAMFATVPTDIPILREPHGVVQLGEGVS